MEDLKKDIKNRVFKVLGCIIALIPIETFVCYLYTLSSVDGLTEIFNRVWFVVFYSLLIIAINSVYIYVIMLPLYDYYEKCRYYTRLTSDARKERIEELKNTIEFLERF